MIALLLTLKNDIKESSELFKNDWKRHLMLWGILLFVYLYDFGTARGLLNKVGPWLAILNFIGSFVTVYLSLPVAYNMLLKTYRDDGENMSQQELTKKLINLGKAVAKYAAWGSIVAFLWSWLSYFVLMPKIEPEVLAKMGSSYYANNVLLAFTDLCLTEKGVGGQVIHWVAAILRCWDENFTSTFFFLGYETINQVLNPKHLKYRKAIISRQILNMEDFFHFSSNTHVSLILKLGIKNRGKSS